MADAVEFKPSQLSLTLVRIHQADLNEIADTLASKLARAGRFLRGAPVVVDPACAMDSTLLAQVVERLRQHDMTPVGIRTADPVLMEYAELCGMAVFKPAGASSEAPAAEPAPSSGPTKASEPPSRPAAEVAATPEQGLSEQRRLTMAHTVSGLRSGQLVKHLAGDVIVRGGINSGAELFSGGNLTVLGVVRGRVHAGATGDTTARIIARDLNPELISIAGTFLLAEDIPALARQGWVEVFLDKQTLKFHSLD